MFITKEPILPSDFFDKSVPPTCGAVNTFLGVVRNHDNGKKVKELFYQCYETMAEKQIEKIIAEVRETTGVELIKVLHRVGQLQVGDIAVAILVSGAHRQESFSACRQVIDLIKAKVPIWKKEVYEDNTQEWVLCTHNTEEEREHVRHS